MSYKNDLERIKNRLPKENSFAINGISKQMVDLNEKSRKSKYYVDLNQIKQKQKIIKIKYDI